MRINPKGTYERAIGEKDYVVPRGGYFFEVPQPPPLPPPLPLTVPTSSSHMRSAPQPLSPVHHIRYLWHFCLLEVDSASVLDRSTMCVGFQC